MRILLVRPPRIKQAITLSDFMFSEPLGLEMVYGALKEDHEIEIFDLMVENSSLSNKINDYKPDLVGITSLCIDVAKVLDLCRETKYINPDITTLVGGTQAYLNSESFFDDNVDHIFEYTTKANLKSFLDSISKGEIHPIDGIRSRVLSYLSAGIKGKNEYMLPDRRSTDKYRGEYSYFGYKPAAIMEFGTGCQKTCNFCLRWRIEGAEERLIDLDLTKNDLRIIKEPTIMFFDNDFLCSEEKLNTFISIVKDLNLKKNYIMYGSVKGVIQFEKYLKSLHDLGLRALLVGYETFSDDELSRYHKSSSTDDNIKAAEILRKYKIDVWASFMAHPDWDKNDFKMLRKYIKKLKPQISTISPLTPFPNLPMYKVFKDRLLYAKEEYERWSFGQVMIKPLKISLKEYYWELLKTNLYVNIFVNKNTEMIKKYGVKNIYRILKGSIKAVKKYKALMNE